MTDEKEPQNKNEKAEKMKSLIDKVQDKQIAKNREDIEKLRK